MEKQVIQHNYYKLRLIKAEGLPMATYGCEIWIVDKKETHTCFQEQMHQEVAKNCMDKADDLCQV